MSTRLEKNLSKLNFPPAPLSYFPSASAEENLCGENNAHRTHAMPRFLYPPPPQSRDFTALSLSHSVSLSHTHTADPLFQSTRHFSPAFCLPPFLSMQPPGPPLEVGWPYLVAIAPSTPPSHKPSHPYFFIFIFCTLGSAVRLTSSQRERQVQQFAGQTSLPLRPNYTGQSQLPCGQPKHFLG